LKKLFEINNFNQNFKIGKLGKFMHLIIIRNLLFGLFLFILSFGKFVECKGRGTLNFTNSMVEAIDMPFGNTSQNGTREYDVLMKINNPTGIRFVEFKSLNEQPDIENKTPLGIDQFIGYLTDSRLADLNGLLYVFNQNKTSETAAKTMFQNIFNHPDNTIKDKIYTAIFPKIQGIFDWQGLPTTFVNQYRAEVNNLNSMLYKFLIVTK
jgi:hypothetical protein